MSKKKRCNDPKWVSIKIKGVDYLQCEKCGQKYSCDELMNIGDCLQRYFEMMSSLS